MLITNVPPEAENSDVNYLSFGFRIYAKARAENWEIHLQNFVDNNYGVDVDLR